MLHPREVEQDVWCHFKVLWLIKGNIQMTIKVFGSDKERNLEKTHER